MSTAENSKRSTEQEAVVADESDPRQWIAYTNGLFNLESGWFVPWHKAEALFQAGSVDIVNPRELELMLAKE
jgi:hypothetical protein